MKTAVRGVSFLMFVFVLISSAIGCGANGLKVPESRESGKAVLEEIEPGALGRCEAFFVEPITVYSIEGDYLRRVEDEEVQKLADDFRRKIIRELDSRHTMMPQPRRNMALLRIAITDVSTGYLTLQLLPGALVPNAMRGGASIEAEFIDSVSGARIALFRDTRQGERQGFLSGLGKWDGVQKAFDEWARMLKGAVKPSPSGI